VAAPAIVKGPDPLPSTVGVPAVPVVPESRAWRLPRRAACAAAGV